MTPPGAIGPKRLAYEKGPVNHRLLRKSFKQSPPISRVGPYFFKVSESEAFQRAFSFPFGPCCTVDTFRTRSRRFLPAVAPDTAGFVKERGA